MPDCLNLKARQDYKTRQEIQTLLDDGDYVELDKRLSTRKFPSNMVARLDLIPIGAKACEDVWSSLGIFQ